jgi:hypothetical protein
MFELVLSENKLDTQQREQKALELILLLSTVLFIS